MHIAFTKPQYLTRDEVPEAEVAEERADARVASPRPRASPRQALDKIVEGRLNGWYKERVLLEQGYVKDEKQTITAAARRRHGRSPRSSSAQARAIGRTT